MELSHFASHSVIKLGFSYDEYHSENTKLRFTYEIESTFAIRIINSIF